MKMMDVTELKPGMKLARDVINYAGISFISAGIELNPFLIERLYENQIDFVFIEEETTQDVGVKYLSNISKPKLHKSMEMQVKEASNNYSNSIKIFKEIYTNIQYGKKIEFEEIKSTVKHLVESVIYCNDFMELMRNLQIFDDYTYKHSVNVSIYSAMIGKFVELDDNQIFELAVSGYLHDIGKSLIPFEIINKKGKLTQLEFEKMKKHVTYSYDISKDIPGVNQKMLLGILDHHERLDGSGYPYSKLDEEISLFGRIIAIADIFDAMTSEKVYKGKESPYVVADELSKLKFNHLDPEITGIFLSNLAKFYVGNMVKLNNGKNAQVVLVNKHDFTRPLVQTDSGFIDLSKDFRYKIVDVL
jgi:HD-GYP domain-containing protein (c-di-GMP phosphodiesterase class II)